MIKSEPGIQVRQPVGPEHRVQGLFEEQRAGLAAHRLPQEAHRVGEERQVRPRRNQPFYHLLAENDDASYVAYVSQQNLTRDSEGGPVDHPSLTEMFEDFADGRYRLRQGLAH